MSLKKEHLQEFIAKYSKKTQSDVFYRNFKKSCAVFNILKPDWFFIQCFYESAFFTRRLENLNYTTLKQLQKVFRTRLPKSEKDQRLLLKNPIGLANQVYKKYVTGTSGKILTGWDVIGEDWLQLTGENNKENFKKKTGIDCWKETHWFSKPRNSFMGSAFYWFENKVDFCTSFEKCTERVNGPAKVAHATRLRYLQKLYKIIRQ